MTDSRTQGTTTGGGRTTLKETQVLSQAGRAALEAAIAHLDEPARIAFWASVSKCYNAPYQEDGHRRRAGPAPHPVPVPPVPAAERPTL